MARAANGKSDGDGDAPPCEEAGNDEAGVGGPSAGLSGQEDDPSVTAVKGGEGKGSGGSLRAFVGAAMGAAAKGVSRCSRNFTAAPQSPNQVGATSKPTAVAVAIVPRGTMCSAIRSMPYPALALPVAKTAPKAYHPDGPAAAAEAKAGATQATLGKNFDGKGGKGHAIAATLAVTINGNDGDKGCGHSSKGFKGGGGSGSAADSGSSSSKGNTGGGGSGGAGGGGGGPSGGTGNGKGGKGNGFPWGPADKGKQKGKTELVWWTWYICDDCSAQGYEDVFKHWPYMMKNGVDPEEVVAFAICPYGHFTVFVDQHDADCKPKACDNCGNLAFYADVKHRWCEALYTATRPNGWQKESYRTQYCHKCGTQQHTKLWCNFP